MMDADWGAIRLPYRFDADRLAAEVRTVGEAGWNGGGRSAPAFAGTGAIFLKGYAAAEGNPSLAEREPLAQMPYARELMYDLLPSAPQKCVLSWLPPGVDVGLHVDQGEYFRRTLRVHFPVFTNDAVTMYFGAAHHLRPGEVWLLNNCAPHGVENAHPTDARVHMICDFLPTTALLEIARRAEQPRGREAPELLRRLAEKTRRNARR